MNEGCMTEGKLFVGKYIHTKKLIILFKKDTQYSFVRECVVVKDERCEEAVGGC